MAETAREFFESLEARVDPRAAGMTASYLFDIEGAGSGRSTSTTAR